MVRVPHDGNVIMQILERMLCVRRAHRHALRDFLVDNDAGGSAFSEEKPPLTPRCDSLYLDALFGFALEQPVKTVLWIERGRPAKTCECRNCHRSASRAQFSAAKDALELRGEPPVEDEDGADGLLELYGRKVRDVPGSKGTAGGAP